MVAIVTFAVAFAVVQRTHCLLFFFRSSGAGARGGTLGGARPGERGEIGSCSSYTIGVAEGANVAS